MKNRIRDAVDDLRGYAGRHDAARALYERRGYLADYLMSRYYADDDREPRFTRSLGRAIRAVGDRQGEPC